MRMQRIVTGNLVVSILAAAVVAACLTPAHAQPPKKPFGLNKVIAFNYLDRTKSRSEAASIGDLSWSRRTRRTGSTGPRAGS